MYSRRQALALGGIGIAALSGCADAADILAGNDVEKSAQPAGIDEEILVDTGYELSEQETEKIEIEEDVGGETRRAEITNHIAIYERAVELSADDLLDGDGIDADDGDIEDDLEDDFDEDDFDEDDFDEDDFDDEDIPDDIDLPSVGQSIGVATEPAVSPQLEGGDTAASIFTLFTTPAFQILGQSLNPVGQMDHEEILELLSGEFGQLSVGEQQSETTRTVLGSDVTHSTFAGTTSQAGVELDVGIEIVTVNNEDDLVVGLGVYPAALAEEESEYVSDLFDGIFHPA